MSDNNDKQRSEADAELEREIRKERKFTVAEAMGRMAGPGAMKGVSPVTRKQQAAVEIENWFRHHLSAGDGELQVVLLRRIKGSELLLHHYERPFFVLTTFCQRAVIVVLAAVRPCASRRAGKPRSSHRVVDACAQRVANTTITACQRILDSDYLLNELVREADVEWGRVQGERPYFEAEGSPPHPDDPYTFESVRKTLAGLIDQLAGRPGW
jgi:hypothetical protein